MFDSVLNMPMYSLHQWTKFAGDFWRSRMSYYPFGVLKIEVKQLTDWIHSTIALENQ